MTEHPPREPESAAARDSSSEKRERRRIPVSDVPDLERPWGVPELEGLLLKMRHEGWELEDLGFVHKTRTRANDPPLEELEAAWVWAEVAKIRGESAHDLVYRRLHLSHATVDRRLAAAEKLLEREHWRGSALLGIAAILAQD